MVADAFERTVNNVHSNLACLEAHGKLFLFVPYVAGKEKEQETKSS